MENGYAQLTILMVRHCLISGIVFENTNQPFINLLLNGRTQWCNIRLLRSYFLVYYRVCRYEHSDQIVSIEIEKPIYRNDFFML